MHPLRVALAPTNWPGSREAIKRTLRALASEATGVELLLRYRRRPPWDR